MPELTIQFADMSGEQFQSHLDHRSVNTHDAARVATFFSEDGVQRRVAIGATARGRAAIQNAMEELFHAFPDCRLEVHDLFSAGNRTCVQSLFTGTQEGEFLGLPPTGRRVEVDVCLVFRWDGDGLAEEEVIYFDSATMLRQLGVLPDTG
jgi:steroid delta-isomerase-like uncharacterized protein